MPQLLLHVADQVLDGVELVAQARACLVGEVALHQRGRKARRQAPPSARVLIIWMMAWMVLCTSPVQNPAARVSGAPGPPAGRCPPARPRPGSCWRRWAPPGCQGLLLHALHIHRAAVEAPRPSCSAPGSWGCPAPWPAATNRGLRSMLVASTMLMIAQDALQQEIPGDHLLGGVGERG